MVATDARVTEQLQEAGYEVRSYSGLLLREPSEVCLEMGTGRWVGHFGTLSPFLRWAAFQAPVRMKKAPQQAACLPVIMPQQYAQVILHFSFNMSTDCGDHCVHSFPVSVHGTSAAARDPA